MQVTGQASAKSRRTARKDITHFPTLEALSSRQAKLRPPAWKSPLLLQRWRRTRNRVISGGLMSPPHPLCKHPLPGTQTDKPSPEEQFPFAEKLRGFPHSPDLAPSPQNTITLLPMFLEPRPCVVLAYEADTCETPTYNDNQPLGTGESFSANIPPEDWAL